MEVSLVFSVVRRGLDDEVIAVDTSQALSFQKRAYIFNNVLSYAGSCLAFRGIL